MIKVKEFIFRSVNCRYSETRLDNHVTMAEHV